MPGELCQRLTVKTQPPALTDHFAVPFQAQGLQRLQHLIGRAGLDARRIEVFDAHQPATASGARVEPARERGDQRTEVQRPRGRGREPADVHACLEYTARFF